VIAVDTNVLAYQYLPTEFTAHADAQLERDPAWVAAVLWRRAVAGPLERNG